MISHLHDACPQFKENDSIDPSEVTCYDCLKRLMKYDMSWAHERFKELFTEEFDKLIDE